MQSSSDHRKRLLAWCRLVSEKYPQVDIINFTTSWSDGLAFNALIHHHRPHLFDFDEVIQKGAEYRICHAFELAEKHFHIPKLLDPEDVCSNRADSDLLMKYVGSIREYFDQNELDMEVSENMSDCECESNDEEDVVDRMIMKHKEDLVDALSFILGAEEHLKDSDVLGKDLKEVKQVFQQHESFLEHLQHFQEQAKEVLQEGKALIESDFCPEDERNLIELQRNLLKGRLEDLSLKAAEFSSIIHETLMALQQKQINSLKAWLSDAEDRLNLLPGVGSDLRSLQDQLNSLTSLQEEIDHQEEVVDSLSNLVWIVDDTDAQALSGDIPDELQDQLAPLAEKWMNVRRSVEDRTRLLKSLCSQWESLEKKEERFNQWMAKLDRRLREMAEAASELHIGSEFVQKLNDRLHRLEREMEIQHESCKEFAGEGHSLADKLGQDTPSGQVILSKLEKMKSTWDEIVQRLATLDHVVTKLNNASSEDKYSESDSNSHVCTEPPSRIPVNTFNRHKKEKMTEKTTGSPLSSASSAKKSKIECKIDEVEIEIEEWHQSLNSFTNWLRTAEELLSVDYSDEFSIKQEAPWFQLSLENQQIILEDSERDLHAHKSELSLLIEAGKKFLEKISEYRADTSQIREIIDAIEKRWTILSKVFERRKMYHQLMVELKRIAKKTEEISQVLKNMKAFLHNRPETKSIDLLQRMQENCTERIRTLKENYEPKVEKIKEEVDQLIQLDESITQEEYYRTIKDFQKSWEDVVQNLQEMMRKAEEALVSKGVIKAESDKSIQILLDTIEPMISWLNQLKQEKFRHELMIPLNSERVIQCIEELKKIEADLLAEHAKYTYLCEAGEDLISKILKSPKINELSSRLKTLKILWKEVQHEIDHRITKTEEINIRMSNLEEELIGLERWLDELDEFFADNPAYGDIQTLGNQVEQCELVLKEIQCSEEFREIEQKCQEIYDSLPMTGDDIEDVLQEKILKLSERRRLNEDKTKEKKRLLIKALNEGKKTQECLENLDQMLESLTFETDEFCHTIVDDYQICYVSGEKLKSRLKLAVVQAQELKEAILALCPSTKNLTESLEEMISKSVKLSELFENLSIRMEESFSQLKKHYTIFGEFNRLVMMEKEWLDRLDRKLKRSPHSAADAEEISGNLDDLETFLRHRPSWRWEKIRELAEEMTNASFLVNTVKSELGFLSQRWKSLDHQSQERLVELEASITDAQQCEQQVLRVQRWLQTVSSQLHRLLEDDILAEDIPHEVEKMDKEFTTNKHLLETLNQSIENYRSQEKLEAASRLGEQLNILNSQYADLLDTFKIFKHPSGFENKINKISKNLHQLMANLQELKVTSHESHVIQDELLECHKMIKEIQSFRQEMDRVSSQGKLALETSANPSLLRVKLDKIKDLFENLSTLAKKRRKELEHLLSISEEISSDMCTLKNWLNSQEEPSSVDPSEFELTKQKLEELTEKVQSFNTIISGKSLPLLTENLNTIQSDFELLQKMMDKTTESKEKNTALSTSESQSSISTTLQDTSDQLDIKPSRERVTETLLSSLDSAHSSLKSTSSRKSSLTSKKDIEPLSTNSKVFRPFDFFTIDEMKVIYEEIGKPEKLLGNSEVLNMGDFRHHNEQKEKLKCIQDIMESNKPKIRKMASELAFISQLHPKGEEMKHLILALIDKWSSVRKSFLQRHRRWWFVKETTKQTESAYKQINIFLEMAEQPLAESRLPSGELNIEVARQNYQSLYSAFSEHVPIFGGFKVMAKKIIENLPERASDLKERIAIIDQRWHAVVRELAWRKERLCNEQRNIDILSYWNNLEQWIESVESTLSKLNGNIDSFEMANILQNEIKNLEQKLPEEWLNIVTVSLAPTILIGKDVESMETRFNQILLKLPEARLHLDKYLTSFKVVARMLEDEIQWVSSNMEKVNELRGKPLDDSSFHEANYEKLVVMLEEIENDAGQFGHKPPSFLVRKMENLKEARRGLRDMVEYPSEPSPNDWYVWLCHQIDYLDASYHDCQDKGILSYLKALLDRIQQLINRYSTKCDNVEESKDDSRSIGNPCMDTGLDCDWSLLKDKVSTLRVQLEANSGDQMNQLLLCLRELTEWVIKKKIKLESLPTIGGDVAILSAQQQEHVSIRIELEEKRPLVEHTLASARSCLPKDLPLLEEEIYGVGIDKTVLNVQREMHKLSEKWFQLLHQFEQRQAKLDEVLKKMITLQQQMADLNSQLQHAEFIKTKWQPIGDLILDHLPDQIEDLKQFKESLYPIQILVERVNDSTTRITGSNVLLSHTNLNHIEELNTRWRLVQVAIEERRKGLEQAMIDHGSVQQQFLSSSVEHPWERAIAVNKVPYYVNHATEATHWDHPKMTELMNSLAEFNEIRYSAYRTAMKLRSVQRRLCLDYIYISNLIETFDEYGLKAVNDKLISVPEMINCLQTIYEKASIVENEGPIDIPLSIDLCLNWLLNLYDTTTRTGYIRILSFKLGLVVLGKGPLEEKYRYMFRLIADMRGVANERKLALLLHDLVQVPRFLGEIAAFGGSNIEPSVRSCFERAMNKSEVEAVDFLSWLQQEPQSIVWLPVLHRLVAAETAKHQRKCNVCKQFPIIGFRYRCLLCFNFDMCQMCFFFGKTAKNHKKCHPMQEYCLATSSGEDVKDLTKIIRNKFKSKRHFEKRSKYGYLPVQTVLEGDNLESPTLSLSNSSFTNTNNKINSYTNRLAEVELNPPHGTSINFDGSTEDEHRLIAHYCQSLNPDYLNSKIPPNPVEVIAAIDADQRKELESIIHELEEENRKLLAEQDWLRIEKGKGDRLISNGTDLYNSLNRRDRSGVPNPSTFAGSYHEEALLSEAKALKTSWKELENKRIFLESQNNQLESTLKRLRQYLRPESEASISLVLANRSRTNFASSRVGQISNLPIRLNGSSSIEDQRLHDTK